MEFDAFPPLAAVPGLVSQMQQGVNHNFNLGPSYSASPFFVFNEVSPNNGGALSKVAVRQALSYGLNRAHLTQVLNPVAYPPLTHILPPGINGSQDVPSGYNPYPYDPTKAKSMLASAGYPNGLSVTLLYRPTTAQIAGRPGRPECRPGEHRRQGEAPCRYRPRTSIRKYLEVPSVAKRGVWDLSAAAWGAGLVRRCGPVLLRPAVLRRRALTRRSAATSGSVQQPVRHGADRPGRRRPASAASAATSLGPGGPEVSCRTPRSTPSPPSCSRCYHASYVHNAVYVPAIQQFDPTNVWLSSPGS